MSDETLTDRFSSASPSMFRAFLFPKFAETGPLIACSARLFVCCRRRKRAEKCEMTDRVDVIETK